ncbi:MAG: hypothetical protein WC027_00860 [Candidatus Paceibacterota bacterium]
MFNISSYLEKFKNIGQSERLLKETILSIIKEVTGIVLGVGNIKVKNNSEVLLSVSPAVKNTIYIKKELILNKIKEKSGQNIISLR